MNKLIKTWEEELESLKFKRNIAKTPELSEKISIKVFQLESCISKLKEAINYTHCCKSMEHTHCGYYEGNGVDNPAKDKMISFTDVARPLIKWLCENEHPLVTAIVTPTSCELLEGKCANPKIFDYVRD